MHPEAEAALAEHNRSALQSITCYAMKALAGQEGNEMYLLPFSGLAFASDKEGEWSAALRAPYKEGSVLAFLSSHQVASTICSPFAALSGESSFTCRGAPDAHLDPAFNCQLKHTQDMRQRPAGSTDNENNTKTQTRDTLL